MRFKMNRSQWPGKRYLIAATFSTTLCLILFAIFGIKGEIWNKTGEDASFFGASELNIQYISDIFRSNPGVITKKYPINIYPAPWLIRVIWPIVVLWNLCGIVYLFYRAFFTDQRFGLTRIFYLLWSLNWIGTILWTFYFDTEDHVACLIVVAFVTATAYMMQYMACKAYNTNSATLSLEDKAYGGMKHPFRYLVIEGVGILSMWSSVAFSVSVAYFFAYKNSFLSEAAQSRGLLTSDQSSTVGITYIVLALTIWVILDIIFFGKFSDCSRVIYPTLSATMVGLVISNYDSNKGLSLNNYLCLLIATSAVVISMTRRKMKEKVEKCMNYEQKHKQHVE